MSSSGIFILVLSNKKKLDKTVVIYRQKFTVHRKMKIQGIWTLQCHCYHLGGLECEGLWEKQEVWTAWHRDIASMANVSRTLHTQMWVGRLPHGGGWARAALWSCGERRSEWLSVVRALAFRAEVTESRAWSQGPSFQEDTGRSNGWHSMDSEGQIKDPKARG